MPPRELSLSKPIHTDPPDQGKPTIALDEERDAPPTDKTDTPSQQDS